MNFIRLPAGLLGQVVLLLELSDCVVGSASSDSVDISVNEIAYAYRDYSRINRTPYRSSVGEFDINVYISPDAAAAYAGIDPARTGSRANVPPGVIVRQVLDAGGAVEKLTIMGKREPGFNPMW